jgi:hypothetical protein
MKTAKRNPPPVHNTNPHTTIRTMRRDPDSEEAMLDLLGRMKSSRESKSDFLPTESDDLTLRRALMEGYALKRGSKFLISDYGQQFLECETGALYLTQIRAQSDDRFRIRQFQARAQSRWHESFQIEDIVRLMAQALDVDTFAVLRGIGVEQNLDPDPNQAAIRALHAIVRNLDVHHLPPGPERDRVLGNLTRDPDPK